MGKPLWIPLWLSVILLQPRFSFFWLLMVPLVVYSNASCFFLFMWEKKPKALLHQPAQSCIFECRWVGSPFPPPKLLFVNTSIYIHKFPSFRGKKKSSTGVGSFWLNKGTSTALHNKAWRTVITQGPRLWWERTLKLCGSSQSAHSKWGLEGEGQSATVPASQLTGPVGHQAKRKIVASRWLICYK